MGTDPEPPVESDAEYELISASPRYAARALLRRLTWMGVIAALCVAGLWLAGR